MPSRFALHCTAYILLLLVTLAACDRRDTPPATTAPAPDTANGRANAPAPPASPSHRATPESRDPSAGGATQNGIPMVDLSALTPDIRRRIEKLQQDCQAAPGSATRLEILARAYASIDAEAAAAQCFDRAAQLVPGNFRYPYLAGLLHNATGAHDAARRAFELAAAIDPEYAPVHVHLGLLSLGEDAAAAGAHFERAVVLDGQDAVAWWGLGKSAQNQNRHPEAVERFQKAVAINPDYRQAQHDLGESLQALGNEGAAKAALKAAESGQNPTIQNDPIFSAFRRLSSSDEEIINYALHHGRSAGAIRAVQILGAVARAGRDGIAIRQTLGNLFMELGEPSQAIDEYNRALAFSPESHELLAQIGIACISQGELDAAATHLDKAKSIAPEAPEVLSATAMLRLARGDAEGAEQIFIRALEKSPDDPALLFLASKASVALGNVEDAKKRLMRCVEQNPGHAPARYALGLILFQTGQQEAGVEHWRRLVKLGGAYPDAYMALSVLASREGDEPAAIRYLRQGITRNPRSAPLANALAWTLATTPDRDFRDAPSAIKLAGLACSLTDKPAYEYLDTLAAAQASNEAFQLAVDTMMEAIRLAETAGADSDQLAQYRTRLELYRKNQPFIRAAQ